MFNWLLICFSFHFYLVIVVVCCMPGCFLIRFRFRHWLVGGRFEAIGSNGRSSFVTGKMRLSRRYDSQMVVEPSIFDKCIHGLGHASTRQLQSSSNRICDEKTVRSKLIVWFIFGSFPMACRHCLWNDPNSTLKHRPNVHFIQKRICHSRWD